MGTGAWLVGVLLLVGVARGELEGAPCAQHSDCASSAGDAFCKLERCHHPGGLDYFCGRYEHHPGVDPRVQGLAPLQVAGFSCRRGRKSPPATRAAQAVAGVV